MYVIRHKTDPRFYWTNAGGYVLGIAEVFSTREHDLPSEGEWIDVGTAAEQHAALKRLHAAFDELLDLTEDCLDADEAPAFREAYRLAQTVITTYEARP